MKSSQKKRSNSSTGKKSLSLPLKPGALSQPRPLPDALQFVKTIEHQIQSAKAPGEIEGLIGLLDGATRLGSIGLAVALYEANRCWEVDWGNFEERIFIVPGYDIETVRRYQEVGRLLHDLPPSLKESFLERPISDLIAIAQHRNEHGELTFQQGKELAATSDHADLREKLRGYSRQKPKKGFLEIVLEADGTLTAWEAGQAEAFGYLNPDLLDGSLGARGRARILKRTRIRQT